MTKDLNFQKILDKLSEIHEDYPDLRFGMVLQTAMDQLKRKKNLDFHELTSKEILKSLQDFKTNVEKSKKKKLSELKRAEVKHNG